MVDATEGRLDHGKVLGQIVGESVSRAPSAKYYRSLFMSNLGDAFNDVIFISKEVKTSFF